MGNFRDYWVQGVRVCYPGSIKLRPGYSEISIRLRRVLWWQWLELDGAKGLAVISE